MQALGGILDVRWAHNGIVTTGEYCTAQGIIQQIGELGVALITLVRTFPCGGWIFNILTYNCLDSHRPHIRSGSVECRNASALLCLWHSRSRISFHWALGWFR